MYEHGKGGSKVKALVEYFSKSLDMKINTIDKGHPTTATTYFNIGVISYKDNSSSDVLENLKEAMKIRKKVVLGADHPATQNNTYRRIRNV